jgi:hypothetical protein
VTRRNAKWLLAAMLIVLLAGPAVWRFTSGQWNFGSTAAQRAQRDAKQRASQAAEAAAARRRNQARFDVCMQTTKLTNSDFRYMMKTYPPREFDWTKNPAKSYIHLIIQGHCRNRAEREGWGVGHGLEVVKGA